MILDLDTIRERYQKALDAKPSKGPWTDAGITALCDSVSDIPILLELLDNQTPLGHDATCARCDEPLTGLHIVDGCTALAGSDEPVDDGEGLGSVSRQVEGYEEDLDMLGVYEMQISYSFNSTSGEPLVGLVEEDEDVALTTKLGMLTFVQDTLIRDAHDEGDE